jgi:hypothetical protein
MRRQRFQTAVIMGLALQLGAGCSAMTGGASPAMEPQAPPAMGPSSATVTGMDVDGARNEQSFAMRMPGTAGDSLREVQTLASSAPGILGGVPRDEKIAFNAGEGDEMGPPPAPPPQANYPQPPPPPITPKPASTPAPDPQQAHAGEVSVIRGPLLVYTAQITIAVFEVNVSLGQVEAIGKELGGFLAKRDDVSVTIRVPVARFEDAVKRVEKIGDMLHRNVTAEDVTEEFRDLEVRLRGARAVQERLTQLLAKATKVEESVLIEKELDRVTGEIDRVEGRMKFLRDRAAYSTITVSFQGKAKDMGPSGPFRLPGRWLYELGLGRLLRL